MNLRHAAVLAIVGWYLMIAPPQVQQGSVVGTDLLAPLSHWGNVHAFETADQCEADKPIYRSQVAAHRWSTACVQSRNRGVGYESSMRRQRRSTPQGELG